MVWNVDLEPIFPINGVLLWKSRVFRVSIDGLDASRGSGNIVEAAGKGDLAAVQHFLRVEPSGGLYGTSEALESSGWIGLDTHRIHGAAIYGVPWIPSRNTPFMLAYIPAPWILWDMGLDLKMLG